MVDYGLSTRTQVNFLHWSRKNLPLLVLVRDTWRSFIGYKSKWIVPKLIAFGLVTAFASVATHITHVPYHLRAMTLTFLPWTMPIHVTLHVITDITSTKNSKVSKFPIFFNIAHFFKNSKFYCSQSCH
jgi:hypothetical protein